MSDTVDSAGLAAPEAPLPHDMPEVVDHVAVARLYGEPLFALPQDLYIQIGRAHV